MKKMKNDEKCEKNEDIWIPTQNPRRFPEFTVVVVTVFVKIPDDFHDFCFGMCLVPEENQLPVLRGRRFPKESDNFNWS